jgi:hypothetical protein
LANGRLVVKLGHPRANLYAAAVRLVDRFGQDIERLIARRTWCDPAGIEDRSRGHLVVFVLLHGEIDDTHSVTSRQADQRGHFRTIAQVCSGANHDLGFVGRRSLRRQLDGTPRSQHEQRDDRGDSSPSRGAYTESAAIRLTQGCRAAGNLAKRAGVLVFRTNDRGQNENSRSGRSPTKLRSCRQRQGPSLPSLRDTHCIGARCGRPVLRDLWCIDVTIPASSRFSWCLLGVLDVIFSVGVDVDV